MPDSGAVTGRTRPSRLKQVFVAIVGSVVTLVGVGLLVLPGPGFLLVAAGLGILATQFVWARRPLHYARRKAEQGVDEIVRSPGRTAFAVVCGLVPLTIGTCHLTGVRVPVIDPYLNGLIAWSIIASGLFLVGLVVYARVRGGIGEGADVRRAMGKQQVGSPAAGRSGSVRSAPADR